MIIVQHFGEDGLVAGSDAHVFLPDYLDWLPIRLKAVWFLERGYGPPDTKHALLISQGERALVTIEKPLRELKFTQLKEQEDVIEKYVLDYATRHGISRTPRNQ